MKDHKLVSHDQHAYTIQSPDGKSFKVAKHGLSMEMHTAIHNLAPAQHMDDGGGVGLPNLGFGTPSLGMGASEEASQPGNLSQITDAAQAFQDAHSQNLPGAPVPASAVGPVANADQYSQTVANQVPEQTSGAPLASAENPEPTPDAPDAPADTAQPATAPQPQQSGLIQSLQKATNDQKDAADEMAAAQGTQSRDQALLLDSQQRLLGAAHQVFQTKLASLDAEQKTLTDGVAAAKIDPNHYVDSMSTGGKILAIIASAIGGGGAALAGQPNLAFQAIQDGIKRDIEAQKDNLANKQGLLRTNLEKYGNLVQATQATFAQIGAITSGQIQAAAARAGTPEAIARANMLKGQLDASLIPVKAQLAQSAAQQSYLNAVEGPGSGSATGGFNATVYNNARKLFPKDADGMAKERGDYDEMQQRLASADKIFDQAPSLAGYADRVLPDSFPTMQESTKQYHALVDPFLDSFAHDTTGRVTPESIALIRHSMPMAGDSSQTIATKRNVVKDIIKNSTKIPLLTGHKVVRPISNSAQVDQKYQGK
jgi:hypothetical protein